uniref:DUSP domain-containing protein n=1 Tax=Globisporangium ultimum (strain ATCC 200006 / CBS 805.95 / DAOM BR144) TaxID=431595 RepID=K3WLH1_GLOUD
MFLISRDWMQQWREYIRNVEQQSPPSLTCSDLICAHGKLLLPQTILSTIKGSSVDVCSVEVEFVSEDEMAHLGELYGVPECSYFYGVMQLDGQIVWRSCSLAELLDSGQDSETTQVAEQLGDCFVDNAAGASVNCLECEQISEIQHQDELQNFQNRVVNVHLLAPDQAVPTEGTVSVEANNSGRQRRSKRIRGGAGGASWSILANSDDSIYVLKTKIYEEIDAYPIRQRLYFKGNVLEDRLSLKDC